MEGERVRVDERRKYLKLMAPRYGCAGRVERTRLLSQMVTLTGLHHRSLPRLRPATQRRRGALKAPLRFYLACLEARLPLHEHWHYDMYVVVGADGADNAGA